MKLIFLPEVVDYFNDLTEILYQKNYFSYLENSFQYVDELIVEIKNSIDTSPRKIAPPYFTRYGRNMRYITIKKSKYTHWYIFFSTYKENDENVYLIRYISNNHVSAQHFPSGN